MGKVKYQDLSEKQKKICLGDFYTMISLLENRNEVKNFFKDLLTLSEAVMISRRIQVAKMLINGAKHREIIDELHVSSPTINYVEKWLNQGFGGYKSVILKHKKKYGQKSQSKSETLKGEAPMTFENLRKKYPAHFLLFNLFLDK